jgi:hypothetical protein
MLTDVLFFFAAATRTRPAGHQVQRVPVARGSTIRTARLHVLLPLLIASTLFASGQADSQPPSPGPAAAPSGLRLVGTVQSKTFSGAVLNDSSGQQLFFRLHDKLPDDSQIVKVLSDSILLKRPDGMLYELFVTQDTSAAVPAGPPASVGPAESKEKIPKLRTNEQSAPRKGRIRKSDPEE